MTILIDGLVPTTRTVIYRVGTTGSDFRTDVINFDEIKVTKITLFNNIQTQQTIILYVKKRFGEFRKVRQIQLKINESADYLEDGEFLPLHPGDELEAETTTADAVDFVVYGDIA